MARPREKGVDETATGGVPSAPMRQRLSWLCAALAGLALAAPHGCADPRSARGGDPRIWYEGRALADWRGRVRFAWPRCAVHVRFRGASLTARLCDTPYEDALRDEDVLGVQVDGGPLRRLALREGVHDYALASGLAPGDHALRLVKLTEAEVGTVRVDRVTAPGGELLPRAPAPRRRMLAVGDSITAGYGVNGPDARCGYGVAYNDASRAWVSLAADALGAELQVIAWSGRGLVRNYDPAARETLVDLFARPVPTDADARIDLRAWVPDDVVLNVGTNDAARPGFDAPGYGRALGAFVRRLRGLYPRARFVLAVGPMLSDDAPSTGCGSRSRVRDETAAVVAAERALGRCTTLLELPPASPDEGCGCTSHPSARTHARMARQLLDALSRAP